MSLLINADDFGKSHSTNMAICEAFAKGLIHRTTLMANMESAKEAMELAKEKGFIDKVGVHLNLTEGEPLTRSISNNREMCDENGFFTADFHRNTLKRFYLSSKTVKDINEELDAQIQRFLDLGGNLMHLDSHHHVHTDLSVLKAIKPLVKKYRITSIRLGRNLYKGGNKLMRLYKVMLNKILNRINRDKCDFFGSVLDFENYFKTFPDGKSQKNMQSFTDKNSVEIMVHPMYVDGLLFDTDYEMSDMSKRLGGLI